ncbi:very short patch repair endonuclease [Sphingomonas sp. LB-2]|nr:very short patch repair endonuclease [Sphingomonas caeni]
MADVVTPAVRSRMMAGIRGKNTKPELVIRKGLHLQGFRYRLHRRNLPGRPDLVFQKHRAVIFVNGCFWHGHDCPLFKWPTSRPDFWREKIGQNKVRDARNHGKLSELGWRQLTVWECALKGRNRHPAEDVISRCAGWLLTAERDGEVAGNEEGISLGLF